MEYSPNGKGNMAPMKYSPKVYGPNGKRLYERFFFKVVMVMAKDKKIQY